VLWRGGGGDWYWRPVLQLAALPTMIIKTTACRIFTIFIVYDFTLVRQFICRKILNLFNMRFFLVMLTALIIHSNINGQTAEDSVKAAINNLFKAMITSDANLIKNSFADSAILQIISRNKEGAIIIRNEAIAAFASSVATMPKNAADERITFETIKIDGPLAIAWTPYNFYYEGKFSHCGVNSFQLVRFNGEWKIQYLIDTRRRQGCTP
jgi:hypothetical protein